MHVFPHLAIEDRVSVPGYVTSFPFYERVEYALAGEVPPGPTYDRPPPASERGQGRER